MVVRKRSRRNSVRRNPDKNESTIVEATAAERLTALASDMVTSQHIIAREHNKLAKSQAEAEGILKTNKIVEFDVPDKGTHEMHRAMGKKSTTLDVDAFRELVGDEEFISIAKVTQGDAKGLITGKQWESITTTKAGVLKDAVYRFVGLGDKK